MTVRDTVSSENWIISSLNWALRRERDPGFLAPTPFCDLPLLVCGVGSRAISLPSVRLGETLHPNPSYPFLT